MKNIIYYISFLIVGIGIGYLFKGCSGGGSGEHIVEVVRDTVTVTNTDTLTLTSKPKIIRQPVYVVDSAGFAVKNEEIERLSRYCDDVQAKLAEAYAGIAKGEQKQVELANLLASKGVVDLPVNHYNETAKGEKTGVTATVDFDVYGYLKGDSLQLILNEDEATIKETKTKKRAFGLTGAFRQEIGGSNQEIGLRIHRRNNYLVYGIGLGADAAEPTNPNSIEVFAGFEIGQKKK